MRRGPVVEVVEIDEPVVAQLLEGARAQAPASHSDSTNGVKRPTVARV